VAVIGGFRYNLSITRKADGTFLQVFCFPKSRINENGGKKILSGPFGQYQPFK